MMDPAYEPLAQAMCTWRHDHRGTPTPCPQVSREVEAVTNLLAAKGLTLCLIKDVAVPAMGCLPCSESKCDQHKVPAERWRRSP